MILKPIVNGVIDLVTRDNSDIAHGVVTVTKIGDGTEENPFRPDTKAKHWQVIEERENEFVIEILG